MFNSNEVKPVAVLIEEAKLIISDYEEHKDSYNLKENEKQLELVKEAEMFLDVQSQVGDEPVTTA